MRSADVIIGEGNEGESGEGQNLPSLSDLRLQAAAEQGGLLDYWEGSKAQEEKEDQVEN